MKPERDLLQRSMDAAPDQWLDQLVAERVMLEVRRESAERASARLDTESAATGRAGDAERESPVGGLGALRAVMASLRALLAQLVPPSV